MCNRTERHWHDARHCPFNNLPYSGSAVACLRLTRITTLDYYIVSFSLHAAREGSAGKRGTNVMRQDVIRHAAVNNTKKLLLVQLERSQ